MLSYLPLILSILLSVFSAYFFGVALLGLKKTRRYPDAKPACKFAVVIPARNEEAVIGALVESLREQDYPDHLYTIYVVPNNCTDDTQGAAQRAGAQILTCPYPVGCKGDVLHQVTPILLGQDYDALCVFDADNLVHPRFLQEMNRAFCGGAKVAKGRIAAKNPFQSWVSGCYDIYFGFFDLFYSRPRACCGLSAKLVGTGFAVHRSVLEAFGGWNTRTLAEDAEFSAQCAAAGIQVAWVPDAITYDEEPVSFRVSLTQRKRWCSGLVQTAYESLPALWRSLCRHKRLLSLDFLLFLLMPFVRALSPLPMLTGLLVAGLTGAAALRAKLWMLPVGLLGAWAGSILLALFIVRVTGRRGGAMWRSVLAFPFFMASFLPLQILALFHRTNRWEPIRHTETVQQPSFLY